MEVWSLRGNASGVYCTTDTLLRFLWTTLGGWSELFDQGKSTKGASKLRRDLINAEIANLRDLLPLPPSTRQRLSQLQLMALVCVYVRKSNYFQQVSMDGADCLPSGAPSARLPAYAIKK
ncbi:unnamed protein product [Spodoptera littoralis]|uniref:BHLH domain-containing protein n=1 Tax=Spodoptera littoralis TaxID=7109 RepID=A0A9P0MYJ4_SPOLI|nr:unnamed protein product [Spodoptera littoralis]CAH1635989.1 unnamed protein product [Spodoptera littoralis]